MHSYQIFFTYFDWLWILATEYKCGPLAQLSETELAILGRDGY